MNPQIIEWARKRSGFSIETLAERMKREPKELESWEAGDSEPSYPVLEELAYRHLKVPVAVFFFPQPPLIEDPVKKFRRLPDFELTRFSPDTHHLIRLAQAYQDSLRELYADTPPPKRIFRDIRLTPTTVITAAAAVRRYLGLSLETQFGFRSSEQALKAWRRAIELAGVYTFKDSFKDKFISGFCIHDDEYPVLMINNSAAFSRQIFTLVHELAHILFHVTGVSDIDDAYVGHMNQRDRSIEVASNQFSAELLVPSESFRNEIQLLRAKGDSAIADIAEKYSVSREVILRRLLDLALITQDQYREKSEEWNRDYLRHYRKQGQGDYYRTTMAYLGAGFTQLAFSKYYKGSISKEQLALHLNVNAKHIDKLETYVTT
jgi:Zn-dependent peptidase ImmA (M78 family)